MLFYRDFEVVGFRTVHPEIPKALDDAGREVLSLPLCYCCSCAAFIILLLALLCEFPPTRYPPLPSPPLPVEAEATVRVPEEVVKPGAWLAPSGLIGFLLR